MPQSILLECVQDIADMIHAKLSAQSMREMLLKKKHFPKGFVIEAEFLRNMRLYVDRHKIQPDMPLSQLRKALTLTMMKWKVLTMKKSYSQQLLPYLLQLMLHEMQKCKLG